MLQFKGMRRGVAAMPIDNKKLAVIHIVKKELSLRDDEYRDILARVAGVESAKELNDRGFRKLMRFLVRSPYYRLNPLGLTVRQKLFILHLSRDIGWTQEHLDNFLHKYYHVEAIQRLSRKEAAHAIESLKHILRHRAEDQNR
jgi:hypothetical protein